MRKPESSTLPCVHSPDRFHAGDGGACRIIWASSVQPDDCVCQQLTIGALHFCAVDYGAALRLNDFIQKKLVSAEREERNQCAIIAAPSSMVALDARPNNRPDRSRAVHTALELRGRLWQVAHPLSCSEWVENSRMNGPGSVCAMISYTPNTTGITGISMSSLRRCRCNNIALLVYSIPPIQEAELRTYRSTF